MLFVKDYTCIILIGKEVVQTFNTTSLSDGAAYRVRDPAKIQGKTQKISCPCPKMPSVTGKKRIVLRYLNSEMGSINIPTEDLSR